MILNKTNQKLNDLITVLDLVRDELQLRDILSRTTTPDGKKALRVLISVVQDWRESLAFNSELL